MRKRAKPILLIVGILCILAAGALMGYNSWEERIVGEETQRAKEILEVIPPEYDLTLVADSLEEGLIVVPDYILDPNMQMPTKSVDGTLYCGTIKVPDHGIDLPVISGWSYPLLKKSPCLYTGSIYSHDAIIMAHNYEIHFRPLWNVVPGDEVIFIDADGNEFKYEVGWIEDIPTDNHDDLMNDNPDWDLTLFTCNYYGTGRVTVRCILVDQVEYIIQD